MELKSESIGDVTIVELQADILDVNNVAWFKAEMAKIFNRDKRKALLDLRQVKFLDSSGIGALISCLRAIKANEGDMKICKIAPSVRALFELVRLHKIFDIVDSREEGLARFG